MELAVFVLNQGQDSALTSLIDIAYALTAAKLTEIAGCQVLLDEPMVDIHPLEDLSGKLESFVAGDVASVHQVFTGPLSGDASLLLNLDGAIRFSNLLVADHLRVENLDSASREILTEAGNMLLSSCLSLFGNLLELRVSSSTARLHLERRDQFLAALPIVGEKRYAVVVTAVFRIREQNVRGRLVIVLALSSLERLIAALDRWGF